MRRINLNLYKGVFVLSSLFVIACGNQKGFEARRQKKMGSSVDILGTLAPEGNRAQNGEALSNQTSNSNSGYLGTSPNVATYGSNTSSNGQSSSSSMGPSQQTSVNLPKREMVSKFDCYGLPGVEGAFPGNPAPDAYSKCKVNINVSQNYITVPNDYVEITYDAPSNLRCSLYGQQVNASPMDNQNHILVFDMNNATHSSSQSSAGRFYDFPKQTTKYIARCFDVNDFQLTIESSVTVSVLGAAVVPSTVKTEYITPSGVVLADVVALRNCGPAVFQISSQMPTSNLCVTAFWMAGGTGYDPEECKNPVGFNANARVVQTPTLSPDGRKWTWTCGQPTKQTCVSSTWVYKDILTECSVPTNPK